MKQIYTLEEQAEIKEFLYNIHLNLNMGSEEFSHHLYEIIARKEEPEEHRINYEVFGILVKKEVIDDYKTFKIYTDSKLIPQYCPEYTKNNFFNWNNASAEVARFSPEYINPTKYNWENYSWAVVQYCPEKLDINKGSYANIVRRFNEYQNLSLKEIKAQAILNKV